MGKQQLDITILSLVQYYNKHLQHDKCIWQMKSILRIQSHHQLPLPNSIRLHSLSDSTNNSSSLHKSNETFYFPMDHPSKMSKTSSYLVQIQKLFSLHLSFPHPNNPTPQNPNSNGL